MYLKGTVTMTNVNLKGHILYDSIYTLFPK